jgi:hypothetical protein
MTTYFIYLKQVALFKHQLQQLATRKALELHTAQDAELLLFALDWLLGPCEAQKKEKHIETALLRTDLPLKDILDVAADLSKGDYLLLPIEASTAVSGDLNTILFLEGISTETGLSARTAADELLRNGGTAEEAETLYCRLLAIGASTPVALLEQKEALIGHQGLNPVERGVLYRHRGVGDEHMVARAKIKADIDKIEAQIRNNFHDFSVFRFLDYIRERCSPSEALELLQVLKNIAREYYMWYVYDDGCKDLNDTFKKEIDRKQFFLNNGYWKQQPEQMLIATLQDNYEPEAAFQLLIDLKNKL